MIKTRLITTISGTGLTDLSNKWIYLTAIFSQMASKSSQATAIIVGQRLDQTEILLVKFVLVSGVLQSVCTLVQNNVCENSFFMENHPRLLWSIRS